MKASWLALSLACLAGWTPPAAAQRTDEAPLWKPDRREQTVQRMRAYQAAAADPAAPAAMRAGDELTLQELQRHWTLTQFINRGLSTSIDLDLLRHRAYNLQCDRIIGAMPAGTRIDPAQPRHLGGAMLLARCGDGGYLMATVRKIRGLTNATVSVDTHAYTHMSGGQATSRLFFKSPAGMQKQTLAVVEDQHLWEFSYWSHDGSGLAGISLPDRLDGYASAAR